MVWDLRRVDKIDGELLSAVLDNEIAGIVLPGFLDEVTRLAVVEGIKRAGMDYYRDVHPPIGRIGITQFEHRHDDRSRRAYFAAANAADQRRRAVFADSGDLLDLVIDALAATWPRSVGLASERDGSDYFAGLIRVIGQGLLHCDWAPHDAPGWAIGSVDAQITWNIYCQVPISGGATVVYKRPWTPDAEDAALLDSYGYSDSVVRGAERVRIKPSAGELTLFNSRNFHTIEGGAGPERISVSSFIGRTGAGELLLWS